MVNNPNFMLQYVHRAGCQTYLKVCLPGMNVNKKQRKTIFN